MTRAIQALFCAILIFMPLALGGTLFWAITLTELAALLMFCLLLLRLNDDPVPHFRWTPAAAPLLLLVGLAVFSCSYSVYPHASMRVVFRLAAYAIL